jgi:hypothetical protein
MEKKFPSFFWLFFDSESLKSKNKKFLKKNFFSKNLVQNYLFGPKNAEILAKMNFNLFHRFSHTKAIKNDGSYDENHHILIFDPFWDR